MGQSMPDQSNRRQRTDCGSESAKTWTRQSIFNCFGAPMLQRPFPLPRRGLQAKYIVR